MVEPASIYLARTSPYTAAMTAAGDAHDLGSPVTPRFPVGISAVPLTQLIEDIGPMSVHAAHMPPEPTPVIDDPVIYEMGEPVLDRPASLLMAVGCRPSLPITAEVVRQAGAGRYAAVIVKARGDVLDELVQAATDADIALLIAPDELPWRDLDSLLTAAIAVAGPRRTSYATVGLGDLSTLANEIAYRVGGALAIEDPNGNVLAYSTLPHQSIDAVRRGGILDRRAPGIEGDDERYRRVRGARGVVRFDRPEPVYVDRLATAVRAGEQLLGILWALDGDPPLGEDAETELLAAARITALHLLRVRSHQDVDRWTRSQTLASLLDGSMPYPVAAAQLGIGVDTPTIVLAIADTGSEESTELTAARIVELVALYCEAWHPKALCAMAGDRVYALLPARSGPSGERSVQTFARDVAAIILRTASLTVRVGIGTAAASLDLVPISRQMADRVLSALASGPVDRQIAGVQDVRSRVVLLGMLERGGLVDNVPGDPLVRILQHDREHSTSYAPSLLAFLDAFGDAPRAARELMVHENTLRYRIRRLPDMFGLDLDDPETRLVSWLRLTIWKLQQV